MRSNVLQLPFCGKSNSKAPVRRPKNADVRSREYLTLDEVKRLRDAAKSAGRHGQRDYMLILVAYRHALRVSELVNLKWDQINFEEATIHINRSKNGKPSVQPIEGDELRALRELRRAYPGSAFVFSSERKGPLSRFTVNDIIERAGKLAKITFQVHPHMLRHSKGFSLANAGHDTRAIQDYLGHKNISHTVRYTELAPNRLKGLGGD